MTARYLDLAIGSLALRARLLDVRSAEAAGRLWAALPLSGRARHDDWSGDLARFQVGGALRAAGGTPVPFQHPGLLFVDPATGDLATVYAYGRLQDGFGPRPAIPVAEIGGDLAPLAALLHDLQFTGALPVRLTISADQTSPLAPAPRPAGRRIRVRLGGAEVAATLLEAGSPRTAAAFHALLPLAGRATNTYSSGPLVRFWNPAGGPEGETPLEVEPAEPTQVLLRPGHLYYLPSRPWRGVRIAARDATAMKGAFGGPGTSLLVPLAAFDQPWDAFRDEAARLIDEGAKPLSFEAL